MPGVIRRGTRRHRQWGTGPGWGQSGVLSADDNSVSGDTAEHCEQSDGDTCILHSTSLGQGLHTGLLGGAGSQLADNDADLVAVLTADGHVAHDGDLIALGDLIGSPDKVALVIDELDEDLLGRSGQLTDGDQDDVILTDGHVAHDGDLVALGNLVSNQRGVQRGGVSQDFHGLASGTVIPSHPSFALKPQGQILSLSLGTGYLLTQYLDGSVTCTTELGDRWTDMVCCDAGARGILGVTLEGRVKARFFRQGDALDLSGLSGIVQCAMGAEHCAFLTEEGQLIVLGDNSFGQCDGNGRKVDF